MLGQMLRQNAASSVAQAELPLEVAPSLFLIFFLDQAALGLAEIAEKQGEGAQHHAGLEIDVLDRLLLWRFESLDANQLCQDRLVGERQNRP